MRIDIEVFAKIKAAVEAENGGPWIDQETVDRCKKKIAEETGWPKELIDSEFQKLLDLTGIKIKEPTAFIHPDYKVGMNL